MVFDLPIVAVVLFCTISAEMAVGTTDDPFFFVVFFAKSSCAEMLVLDFFEGVDHFEISIGSVEGLC